ncbi:MAG: MAPEG family protein [bacterium]
MTEFLTPVLALIIWTFIMMFIMYARRIPAMQKISKDTQEFIRNPKLGEQLPDRAKWAADNYNHLHEQPVIFYALMFYIYLVSVEDILFLGLAWAYVVIRIIHSLVQISSNLVRLRFALFMLGSLILIVMGLRAVVALF